MAYLQVAAGLALLLLGAEGLVRGAVALAHRLGVSPLMIGLTIVAWGTTAPELLVSVEAASEGLPGLAVGNVVGSNIANVLLILGAAAAIFPVACRKGVLKRDGAFMIVASLLFAVLALTGSVHPWEGVIMIIVLMSMSFLSYRIERRNGPGAEMYAQEAEAFDDTPHAIWISLAFVVGGFAFVILGAHLLIDGAVGVAHALGVSDTVIGLTMVAVGTSLPELATAVVAAWRGHPEVAIGNVVGANTYNVLAIIGVVSLVAPIHIPEQILRFDLWFMLATSMFLVGWIVLTNRLGRAIAAVMLLLYAGFVASQFYGWTASAVAAG
jgi:cation:H+ antiporter